MMIKKRPRGVMGVDYHHGRRKKRALIYRLHRRTKIVNEVIEKYACHKGNFLDMGTADGLMLRMIKDKFTLADCWGLEYNRDLIKLNKDKRIKILQGDILDPPMVIKNKKFDVVIAAAVIEHLVNVDKFAKVVCGLLRQEGILIITTPDPFFEKAATLIGHLPRGDHQRLFRLEKMKIFFESFGFRVLRSQKFMFSPVGFPYEEVIEKMMRKLKLNFLMANQLLVLKKKNSVGFD